MRSHKLIFLLLLAAALIHRPASAKLHSFIGFNKRLKDVQDQNGKVESKPFSPTLSIGDNFAITNDWGFSPQLGYIHTTQERRDSYGDQKTHSFFLNWDFITVSSWLDGLAWRIGIGNFIKRVHGKGGTVQIPNGSGTATARRPGGTVSSYSNTFDFGFDYKFGLSQSDWFTDLGLRFQLYVFRPLSKDNRSYAFNLGFLWFF